MYKTITVLSIKEGTDPDAFIKYHTQSHALDARKIGGSGLRRYVVNRILEVMGGQTKKYFALVEMWWENKGAHDAYAQKGRTFKTASGMNPSEDFEAHGGIFEFKLHVEEYDIPSK